MKLMTKHKPRLHLHFYKAETCSGKRCYSSKQQAETVKQEQELLQPGLELGIYRCQSGCSQWHLTRSKR